MKIKRNLTTQYKVNIHHLFICLLCLFLVACSAPQKKLYPKSMASVYAPLIHDMLNPHAIKAQYGFETLLLTTSHFTLFALLRPADVSSSHTLHVYIEGDGLVMRTRTMLSSDPTPTIPTSFTLAKADPSKNAVLYLARPCQYIMRIDPKYKGTCQQKYWTTQRYSLEVAKALNEAVDMAKKRTHAKHVALVGYSGGGALAVLMASKRNDVAFLGSVAGALDTDTIVQYHQISPFTGSANPLHVVDTIKHIPQRHVMSTNDHLVPPVVNKNFCEALPKPESCISIDTINHYGKWETVWGYDY